MDLCQSEKSIPDRMLNERREHCESSIPNLGHPGVKEMIRVLKHGRASELAIQDDTTNAL